MMKFPLDSAGLEPTATDGLPGLFGSAEPACFSRNQVVMPPRGANGELLIIKRGCLIIEACLAEGQRQVLGFRFPGDFLCTFFNQYLLNASAVALTEGSFARIPHAALRQQIENNSSLAHALVKTAANQMEATSLHNLLLGRLNVQQRVASFLLEMVRRCGRRMVDGVSFALPMTREDIGDYLGLNADTVSRALSKLRKDRILGLNGQHEIFVRDVTSLQTHTPLADALNRHYGDQRNSDLATLLTILRPKGGDAREIRSPGMGLAY